MRVEDTVFTLTAKPKLFLMVATIAGLVLPACEGGTTSCIPTDTGAVRADKVDLRTPGRSSTLQAKLLVESDSRPLEGKTLTFDVLDDDATVYSTTASTGADGVAAIDLKRVDVDALTALARADRFRASFPGDSTYCSSSGVADVHITTL
jgi:hypothetical protein